MEHGDNNIVTSFDLDVFENNGKYCFVISESPENKGHSINKITKDISGAMQNEYNLTPEQLVWYEQKKTGNYEKVNFHSIGRNESIPGTNEKGEKFIQWCEGKREGDFSKKEIEENQINNSQEKIKDFEMPGELRESASDEELEGFQKQVEQEFDR